MQDIVAVEGFEINIEVVLFNGFMVSGRLFGDHIGDKLDVKRIMLCKIFFVIFVCHVLHRDAGAVDVYRRLRFSRSWRL
jgi:hypothetical protein